MKEVTRKRLTGLMAVIAAVFLSLMVVQSMLDRQRALTLFKSTVVERKFMFDRAYQSHRRAFEKRAVEFSGPSELTEPTLAEDTKRLDRLLLAISRRSGFDYAEVLDHTGHAISRVQSGRAEVPADSPLSKKVPSVFANTDMVHFFRKSDDGTVTEIVGYPIREVGFGTLLAPKSTIGFLFVGQTWKGSITDSLSQTLASSITFSSDEPKIEEPRSFGLMATTVLAVPLLDLDRQVVSWLKVEKSTPSIATMSMLMLRSYLLVGLFAVVVLVIISWGLGTWVNRPLKAISASLETDDPHALHSIRNEKSEFGQFARLMLKFFEHRSDLSQEIVRRKDVEKELEIARDRALEAARLKSEFLANMSHEIRTPMNGIVGMIDLLERTPLTPSQADYVGTVRASTHSLLRIINDILDFSKIEAGKLALESAPMRFSEVVSDVTDLYAPGAQEKDVAVFVEVPFGDPIPLVADSVRLRQVLSNLIANAIKFTDQGHIAVRVSVLDRSNEQVRVRVEVEDTGIGIEPDRLDAIFESFTQADGTTTRRFGGTGLGLSVTKRIVELMGGWIGVRSSVGVGSTFWFEFFAEEPPFATARWSAVGLRNRKVTIIDPYAPRQESYARMIMAGGAEIELQSSLTDLSEADRDIVVLDSDALMPWGMDPVACVEVLHRLALQSKMIVLFADSGFREALTRAGLQPLINLADRPMRLERFVDVLGDKKRFDQVGRAIAEPQIAPGANVLVVEDNTVNQKVLVHMLHRLGCLVDIAENGLIAIERMSSKRYDLVFMDWHMPTMSGDQATREIRRIESASGRRTPIIATTASAMEGDREQCLEAGMDDFIAKPITQAAIASIVSRYYVQADRSDATA